MKWILCNALFAARSSMKTIESFGKGGLFCRLDGIVEGHCEIASGIT